MSFSILTNVPAMQAARQLEQTLNGYGGALSSIATGDALATPATKLSEEVSPGREVTPSTNKIDLTA